MSTSVTRCATVSRGLGEAPAATAPAARTWLLLEQPGPWGAKAFTASHLDPALGRALEAAAAGTGVRLAMIRRPGRHADEGPRRIFVAHTAPGTGWVRTTLSDDPAALLDLDYARLGAGSHDGFGSSYDGRPLALVCANGRRDQCCALQGRPLAAELAASGLGQVWETTHLGGHRFAPTMLVLPYGYAYARLDSVRASAVLEAAQRGRMVPDGCRGRTMWERPGQAAELAVREATGEDAADALRITGTQPLAPTGSEAPAGVPPTAWRVGVAHIDGRAWTARVETHECVPPRPESCGGGPVTPTSLRVTGLQMPA